MTTANANITQTLAEFVASVRYEDLPSEAVDRAKPLILDYLGASIAGGRCAIGEIALELGRRTEAGGDATVIGADYATSMSGAAFINGTLAHALDIDDTAAGTVGHPSAPLLPALLALAEHYRYSGQALLTAYIVGLEVFYRIALASEGQMGGWHRSSLFGALATAAACAKLLSLDQDEIQTAIGISTSLTGGVQLNFGSMAKAVQVGNASRSGLLAALLAKQGCTANPAAFDDPNGFGFTFYSGRFNAEKIVTNLGNPFNIIFPGIGVKIHPCCGLTHAPADIVLDLVAAHGICADQVSEVVVFGEELWPTVLVYPQPKTGYQGKYSLPYVVAAAIIDRQIGAETFTDEQVGRPQVQAFLPRVRLRVRPDSEWESLRKHAWNHCAEVVIRLHDGTEHRGEAPCARGYPDLPLSSEEIVSKFRSCAEPALSQQTVGAIIDRALALESEHDLSQFVRLSAGPPSI